MNPIINWLSAHPKIVAVLLVCVTVALIVALIVGADVMIFFEWLSDLVG